MNAKRQLSGLKKVDFSKNTELKEIKLSSADIETLDLTKNKKSDMWRNAL